MVRQRPVISPFGRGCDNASITGAEKNPCLLAKIAGGEHFFQIVFREIQAHQDAEGVTLITERGIINHHRFIGHAGFKDDGVTAFAAHTAGEIAAVQAVGDASVGSHIDAGGIGKMQGVKIGVFFQFTEHFCADIRFIQSFAQTVGVIAYPPLGIGELAVDSQRSLLRGINGIVQIP